MKTRKNFCQKIAAVFFITVIGWFLLTASLSAQGWYDGNWQHRIPVTVYNPGTSALADFQVLVTLNATNFDFSRPLSDGRDLRVTAADGTTLIPFWLESWNQATETASIWVKVPSIPADSTIVFFYYGNSSPSIPPPVETPPTGPFTRDVSNPISPIGDPGAGANLLAENIIYDPVSGHYWMVFANYRSGSYGVGLVWSDDPTDASSWHWHGNIYTHTGNGSFAPHIIYENGLWYVFFASLPNVVYITCPTINGTYSAPTVVLSPSAAWEAYRVDEPYVFKRSSDNKWFIVYMGDAGSTTEQIGYATADNITGPYTKYSGNPCIAFGPAGSYDEGTVADPWVYEYYGTYYIGYTVSSTKSSPWSTACVTTNDWTTFNKIGMIFPVNTAGWDASNSFRGAVTRIGDEYVFSYTGGTYRMGIATQPVFRTPASLINNPENVFDFYDGFDYGTDPDLTKWSFASGNAPTHTSISSGILLMSANSTFVRLNGLKTFGMNYISETRAMHRDQGTDQLIAEVGMVQAGSGSNGLNYAVRIADDFKVIGGVPSTTYWQKQANNGVGDNFENMAQRSDRNWHIFRVFRHGTNTAGFQIDNNPVEGTTLPVPTTSLVPFLMSYGNGNDMDVDWTRIRKYVGTDPVTAVGAEWTGSAGTDWGQAGSWISGFVPRPANDVFIQNVPNLAEITGTVSSRNIVLEPLARMTVATTGSLSVTGAVTVNTSSTLASGSLINLGTVNGTVVYNRYLLPRASGGDFQLASSPVVGNLDNNTDDIQRVKSWDELSGLWTTGSMINLPSGRGYNLKQTETGDRIITFRGSLVTGDVEIIASSPFINVYDGSATQYATRTFVADALSHSGKARDNDLNWGGGGWNLLGNPFTSSMSVARFIGENSSLTPADNQFDPSYVALYLFDGANNAYRYVALSTGWEGGDYLNEDNIQAGQGFFVLAMNDLSTFKFTRSMQEHDVDVPMLKSAEADNRWPGLQLTVKHSAGESTTLVVYNEDMTTGLDPGYDIGQYSNSPAVEVYTTLVSGGNDINFTRQALPIADFEKNIIPIGLDTEDGGEVMFTASCVPVGSHRFWLHDKLTGLYTDLTTKSYSVSLPSKSYGTGRFYIIASANTPTEIQLPQSEDSKLRIWKSGDKIVVSGEVTDKSVCTIYDIRGSMIIERRLTGGDLNTIDLPSGLKGVYVVRVTDGVKNSARKIAIL